MPAKPSSPCTFCGAKAVNRGRCERHQRGTTAQRGYGRSHEQIREKLAPLVAAGRARCWRCKEYIKPGEPWDLGHNNARTGYNGPEHQLCNRRAAAQSK